MISSSSMLHIFEKGWLAVYLGFSKFFVTKSFVSKSYFPEEFTLQHTQEQAKENTRLGRSCPSSSATRWLRGTV